MVRRHRCDEPFPLSPTVSYTPHVSSTGLASAAATGDDASESPSPPSATPPSSKARLLYLQGSALNAAQRAKDSEDGRRARTLLEQAVKLDPECGEAWTALGHHAFKNGDLATARVAFNRSLAVKPTTRALRLKGMLLRQLDPGAGGAAPASGGVGGGTGGSAGSSSVSPVEESVACAKQAVALDMGDSRCWTSLGNAMLSLFFSQPTSDVALLARVLQAYNQAVAREAAASAAASLSLPARTDLPALPTVARDPDLHFNRGTVLCYVEDYRAAVAAFEAVRTADPTIAVQVRPRARVARAPAFAMHTRRPCAADNRRRAEPHCAGHQRHRQAWRPQGQEARRSRRRGRVIRAPCSHGGRSSESSRRGRAVRRCQRRQIPPVEARPPTSKA